MASDPEGGLPRLSIHATVVSRSAPGSVRTMCSLAASRFHVEGGETRVRSCDWATLRERGAPWAIVRCHSARAVYLLPHGQIRVLAVGLQIALSRLSQLPAADSQASRDPTRWYGWYGAEPSRVTPRAPGWPASGAVLTSDVMSKAGAGRHSPFEGLFW